MVREQGKNLIKKDEVIFSQGEKLEQLAIILGGKVLVQSANTTEIRNQGSFLGLNDRDKETYQSTYIALEDSNIYFVSYNDDAMHQMIGKNGNFRAIMVTSQFKEITELNRIREDLYNKAQRFFLFTKKTYETYIESNKQANMSPIQLEELEALTAYEPQNNLNEYLLRYFSEGAKIPLDASKNYFAYSEEMVMIQVIETSNMINDCKDEITAIIEYIQSLLQLVVTRPSHNLYEYACVQGQEMRRQGTLSEPMIMVLNEIVEESVYQNTELKKQMKSIADLPADEMKKRINDIVSKEMTESEIKTKEEKEARIKRDVLSLKNTTDQIIQYALLEEEKATILKHNLDILVKAQDRLSVEDHIKKAKKTITPIIFDLILRCYNASRKTGKVMPKAVELFVNYGLADERLLDEEQLYFLCEIENYAYQGTCNVFTLMEWLDAIHEGKREPSKSEFDEDYIEHLRSLKKQGDINEEQEKKLATDMDERVKFEVENMITANTKTLYGQPTAYMPVLYKEAIFGYMDNLHVTASKVNESINSILKIDYSAFYREAIYSNVDLKITNEMIQKNVYPDIIIFPICGTQAAMWQEVGGKSKTTPGRFCIPAFLCSNLDDQLVKLVGRFRWELCRCIQGTAWNDIKEKSLTSEYMDYIQFFKKNRDLSDEAREKVKLQIQKARNNSRETFLIDYEAWIKNESNGSMKMNKAAREILATYCPFAKELRLKLEVQRPYEVAFARFEREKTKKKQETELKIKAIQKITEDVPEEIKNMYTFYSEN